MQDAMAVLRKSREGEFVEPGLILQLGEALLKQRSNVLGNECIFVACFWVLWGHLSRHVECLWDYLYGSCLYRQLFL